MLTKIQMASTIDSFLIFPPERKLYLDELQVSMPEDTPDLYQVFLEIYNHHKDRVLYTLELSIGRLTIRWCTDEWAAGKGYDT